MKRSLFGRSWAGTKAGSEVRSRAGRSILVVEGFIDLADTMKLLFEHEGHAVVTAYSGRAALTALETFAPEIVMVDLHLPDLDGYQLADELHEHPNARDAYFIAVTGLCDPMDDARARAHGFAVQLRKPYEAEVLFEVIDRAPRAPAR